ncbi:MAG TPA: BatA and WFA domain-containing protein [Anaerolineae bacterium]|nr:BatA and WFA domain-containing protein [Anaerolineae bacterium]
MSLLAPVALLLGALAIPILILYMLKLRRREAPVSSTLLWQMLLRDRQANAPWQRLKRNLLLLLQLLILAALVVALARPAIQVPTVASGSVVVLLDASASMQATDVAPARFEAARAAARNLIDALPGDARVTLILAGQQPQALAASESDKATLRRALDAAQPTPGAANWEAALALAAGAAGSSGERATTVVISDGGLPEAGLPPLPGEVRYLPIGQSADNLALAALAVRPTASGAELFASVSNAGDTDRTATIALYRDDEFFSSQLIDIPAGESANVVLTDLPSAPAIYQARLSNPDQPDQPLDALPLDDVAFAVHQPSAERSVLLVSAGNVFLEQLLAALPGLTPYRALPDADGNLQLPSAPFDLYVFDGVIPGELPAADLLLINPPANPLFPVGGVFTETVDAQVADHPLTRFVDWSSVHVLQARQIEQPTWADVLISVEAGPLAFAGETGGRRVAVVAFDLHDSDLPLQVTYPILFSNLINYLAPARAFDAPDGLRPGASLRILPDLSVNQVVIASPAGRTFPLSVSENGVNFTTIDELGVYAVNYLTESDQTADFFAVNLFDPAESDIRPAPAIQIGRGRVSASAAAEVGQRELWPGLAALAIVVLTLEWWVYHRRQSLLPVYLLPVYRQRGKQVSR